MPVQWLYESDGFRRGPVASGELKKLAESGAITPETLIWRDGLEEWVKAGVVRGLFSAGQPSERLQTAAASSPVPLPPPISAAPPSQEWYYSIRGAKVGPVSSAEIKRLADLGELSRTDLLWKEGLASWVAASSVRGLFAQPPTASSVSGPSTPVAPPELPSLARQEMLTSASAEAASTESAGHGLFPLHVQRKGVAIAAMLGGAATFMPWANLPIVGEVDGTVGDGWITIVLFIVAVVASLYGNRGQPIGGWPQLAAVVLPTLASIIGVAKIVQINGVASSLRAKADAETLGGAMAGLVAQAIRPKFGLYILVVAGLAAAAAAICLSPQRLSLPTRIMRPGRLPFPRAVTLPLHVQRMAVVLFALVGASAAFMPWLQSVDDGPVLSMNASQASPQEIMEVRRVNVKYAEEMGKQMGKKAELLGDVQSSAGTNLSGGLTFALFVTAMAFGVYGIRTRALDSWVRVCVVIPAIVASGVGLWEAVQVGGRDRTVRATVREYASDRWQDSALSRLDKPVLKAGFGIWLVIAAGVATAAAVPLLKTAKLTND
jgi:hypothetical protein